MIALGQCSLGPRPVPVPRFAICNHAIADPNTKRTSTPLAAAIPVALDLTPEQKAAGKANFEQASGDLARAGKMSTMATHPAHRQHEKPDRRDFLKAGLAAGAVVPVSAAVYYGYQSGGRAFKAVPHRGSSVAATKAACSSATTTQSTTRSSPCARSGHRTWTGSSRARKPPARGRAEQGIYGESTAAKKIIKASDNLDQGTARRDR